MGKVCSLLSGRQGPLDVTDVCNAIKEVEQRVEDLGLFHGASRDLTPKAAKQLGRSASVWEVGLVEGYVTSVNHCFVFLVCFGVSPRL